MIERIPVPPDRFEMFKHVLLLQAAVFKVHDDPDVANCLDLLVLSIDRHINDKRTGIGYNRKKMKKQAEKSHFIKLFETKYYQYHDLEYSIRMTSKDMGIIDGLIKKLEGAGSNFEEYLTWWFDRFLPENKRFEGACVSVLGSQNFIQKFMVENRGTIKKRKTQQNEKLLSSTISKKARALIREGHKDVVPILRNYMEKKISVEDFQKEIEKIEKES